MNPNIQTFHDAAMNAADEADKARKAGDLQRSKKFFAAAYSLELQAIALAEEEGVLDLTVSVLRNSATALKKECE